MNGILHTDFKQMSSQESQKILTYRYVYKTTVTVCGKSECCFACRFKETNNGPDYWFDTFALI